MEADEVFLSPEGYPGLLERDRADTISSNPSTVVLSEPNEGASSCRTLSRHLDSPGSSAADLFSTPFESQDPRNFIQEQGNQTTVEERNPSFDEVIQVLGRLGTRGPPSTHSSSCSSEGDNDPNEPEELVDLNHSETRHAALVRRFSASISQGCTSLVEKLSLRRQSMGVPGTRPPLPQSSSITCPQRRASAMVGHRDPSTDVAEYASPGGRSSDHNSMPSDGVMPTLAERVFLFLMGSHWMDGGKRVCTFEECEDERLQDVVVWQGWLWKQGHVVTNWKLRWFVLTNRHVLYYASPEHARKHLLRKGAHRRQNSSNPNCHATSTPDNPLSAGEASPNAESPAGTVVDSSAVTPPTADYDSRRQRELLLTQLRRRRRSSYPRIVHGDAMGSPPTPPMSQHTPVLKRSSRRCQESSEVVVKPYKETGDVASADCEETTAGVIAAGSSPGGDLANGGEGCNIAGNSDDDSSSDDDDVGVRPLGVIPVRLCTVSKPKTTRSVFKYCFRISVNIPELVGSDYCEEGCRVHTKYIVAADHPGVMKLWRSAIQSQSIMAPYKQGWIHKRGHVNRDWRRRWFVLRRDVLTYSRELDGAPYGIIPLAGCEIRPVVSFDAALYPQGSENGLVRRISLSAANLQRRMTFSYGSSPVRDFRGVHYECRCRIVVKGVKEKSILDRVAKKGHWVHDTYELRFDDVADFDAWVQAIVKCGSNVKDSTAGAREALWRKHEAEEIIRKRSARNRKPRGNNICLPHRPAKEMHSHACAILFSSSKFPRTRCRGEYGDQYGKSSLRVPMADDSFLRALEAIRAGRKSITDALHYVLPQAKHEGRSRVSLGRAGGSDPHLGQKVCSDDDRGAASQGGASCAPSGTVLVTSSGIAVEDPYQPAAPAHTQAQQLLQSSVRASARVAGSPGVAHAPLEGDNDNGGLSEDEIDIPPEGRKRASSAPEGSSGFDPCEEFSTPVEASTVAQMMTPHTKTSSQPPWSGADSVASVTSFHTARSRINSTRSRVDSTSTQHTEAATAITVSAAESGHQRVLRRRSMGGVGLGRSLRRRLLPVFNAASTKDEVLGDEGIRAPTPSARAHRAVLHETASPEGRSSAGTPLSHSPDVNGASQEAEQPLTRVATHTLPREGAGACPDELTGYTAGERAREAVGECDRDVAGSGRGDSGSTTSEDESDSESAHTETEDEYWFDVDTVSLVSHGRLCENYDVRPEDPSQGVVVADLGASELRVGYAGDAFPKRLAPATNVVDLTQRTVSWETAESLLESLVSDGHPSAASDSGRDSDSVSSVDSSMGRRNYVGGLPTGLCTSLHDKGFLLSLGSHMLPQRQTAAEIAFENLGVADLCLPNPTQLALVASHCTTGTVVDIGETTRIGSYFHSNPCSPSISDAVGGFAVSRRLAGLLTRRGHYFLHDVRSPVVTALKHELCYLRCIPPSTAKGSDSATAVRRRRFSVLSGATPPTSPASTVVDGGGLSSSPRRKMMRSRSQPLVESFHRRPNSTPGDCTPNADASTPIAEETSYCGDNASSVGDASGVDALGLGIDGLKMRRKTVVIPGGDEVRLQGDRHRAAEVLFQPHVGGFDGKGLSELILESILSSDPTVRRSLYRNIVLCGGGSLLPGLAERVRCDIMDHVAHQNVYVSVKTPRPSLYQTWIGGSVFSQVAVECGTYERVFLDRSEYEDYGPAAVWHKFGLH